MGENLGIDLVDQQATKIAFSTKVIDDKIVQTDTVFKDETGLTHVFDKTGTLIAKGYGDAVEVVKKNKNLIMYGGLAAAALVVVFMVTKKKRKKK